MRILGNLTFAGNGVVEKLRVENLAEDPASPQAGQVWYNTASGVYKGFDGTSVVTFASGGNTETILAEVNKIEAGAGLDANGDFVAYTGKNYINGATTLADASSLLDAAVKVVADAAGTAATDIDNLETNVTNIETATGLNADGTYTATTGSNYLDSATNLKDGLVALDAAIKIADDAADAAQATADLKVAKAGDTMTGNLAFGGTSKVTGLASPTAAGDAANKAYVDALASGLTWENPVSAIREDHTAFESAVTVGMRIVNSTDNKIYTATAEGVNGAAATFDGGEALVDGAAFFDKTDETGYVFNGVEIVQFTGTGQMTAGVGLVKTGNVIDVNLGAGIGQLPTDEVGIDVLTAGGLFLTVDGSAASTDTAAQLAVKLDGATLARSADGVKVAAQGITATEIATTVAGNGITGGNGAALSVVADEGIVVTADGVGLDLTFADARYINTAGDTMTGALVLAADPTADLEAATKQYVDALATKLAASTFVYDGNVANATHVVTHNLGSQFANVTVVDSANKAIIPDSITFDSATQLTVTFSSAITCKVVVSGTKA